MVDKTFCGKLTSDETNDIANNDTEKAEKTGNG